MAHKKRVLIHKLYNFLFGKIEKNIEDKTELVIIPDGILAFLPFETLRMPDGRYLIEKYDLKYLPSLTVSELIDGRCYPEDRKPMLAFGGALYEEASGEKKAHVNIQNYQELKRKALLKMGRGENMRDIYRSLGFSGWRSLPGTLEEVRKLKEINPHAEIHTGNMVSESRIKMLVKSGDLKQYSVVHFATHGIVVPEIPELSAIVLSLFKNEQEKEDGFLNMREIARLDLQADFINLSACETGLGKIFRGEGIAGSKGVAVSLWQVSDISTTEFMTEMYRLVKERGVSYLRAISEMKRRFIVGKEGSRIKAKARGLNLKELEKKPECNYSNPFYWVPFIYYGN